MIKELNELATSNLRNWDVFKSLLGLFFLSASVYIWNNNFLEIQTNEFTKILLSQIGLYILLTITVICFILGFMFFITGINEMERNYDRTNVIKQITYIKSLKELRETNLKNFSLDQNTEKKFKKYTKNKLKEAIEYFE
jgi:type III secretory pathway component EscU